MFVIKSGVAALVKASRTRRNPTETGEGTLLMYVLRRTSAPIADCGLFQGAVSALQTARVLYGCTEDACTGREGDSDVIERARRVTRQLRRGAALSVAGDDLRAVTRHGVVGSQRTQTAEAVALVCRGELEAMQDAAVGAATSRAARDLATAGAAGVSVIIRDMAAYGNILPSLHTKIEASLDEKEAAVAASVAAAGAAAVTWPRCLAVAAADALLSVIRSR
jgi:hypothetical protein